MHIEIGQLAQVRLNPVTEDAVINKGNPSTSGMGIDIASSKAVAGKIFKKIVRFLLAVFHS